MLASVNIKVMTSKLFKTSTKHNAKKQRVYTVPNINIYDFLVYPNIGKLSLKTPKNKLSDCGTYIIVKYNVISFGLKPKFFLYMYYAPRIGITQKPEKKLKKNI